MSFRNACEILQHDVGLVAGSTQIVKQGRRKKLASPLVADADDQALLHRVVDYYHATLKQDSEALAYLKTRGLDHAELIDRFKLGYANRTLGYRLPEKSRKAGAELRGRLQALGILRESGHEHFNGSIVVPIINDQRITELYGRRARDDLREGTPYHLYLPGEHAGVWNLDALHTSPEIIICEALLDAMTLWVHGFKNVTASYGTNGFTADHLAAFKKYGTQRVLIAYDRDAAGDRAAESLAQTLMAEGIECFRMQFPKGMDANAYAVQVGTSVAGAGATALHMSPAAKALGLVIRKAVWMGKGDAPREGPGQRVEADDTPIAAAMPLLASPVTVPPVLDPPLQTRDGEVAICFGDRRYRVRGLDQNLGYGALKINVLVTQEERYYVDTFDLYNARARTHYIAQAAHDLHVQDALIKADLGHLLLKLEALQEEQIRKTLEVKPAAVAITEEARVAALDLLRDPSLLSRLLSDFNLAGVVGEETNKLVAYLACVSRKLEKPLAVMIQSSSAAGKSSLMESVLAFIPEEERVQYSAMTGQSLFYMGETRLKNKILAIAEEEGAHNASYALKLLQSEGEVTIASTGKDEASGNLITKEYKVEGPVMLLMTTTAIDLDEELLNRCLVLSVNESREQTQAIHRAQRLKRTLAGLQAKLEKDRVLQLHRNAQRLLRPLAIINPYADQLTFLDDKTRMRRDHEKYLTLIDSIALLHQHQRAIKTTQHAGETIEYIEVTLDDVETANRLAHEVLGKTLDELPPQTRKLLKLIQHLVREVCAAQSITQRDYRFSRKAIRDYTGWGNTQLKLHCHRLEEMEYLLVHRGGRGQSFDYELLYSADRHDDEQHLMGLIDVQKLTYDEKKSGLNVERSGSSRPQVGGLSGPSRPPENNKNSEKNSVASDCAVADVESVRLPASPKSNGASYRSGVSPLAAAATAEV